MFKDLVKAQILKRIETYLNAIEKYSDENADITHLAATSKSVVVQGTVSSAYLAREKEIFKLSNKVVYLSNIFKD